MSKSLYWPLLATLLPIGLADSAFAGFPLANSRCRQPRIVCVQTRYFPPRQTTVWGPFELRAENQMPARSIGQTGDDSGRAIAFDRVETQHECLPAPRVQERFNRLKPEHASSPVLRNPPPFAHAPSAHAPFAHAIPQHGELGDCEPGDGQSVRNFPAESLPNVPSRMRTRRTPHGPVVNGSWLPYGQPKPIALRRPELVPGTRITVLAAAFSEMSGSALLDVDGTRFGCTIVEWRPEGVTLDLPRFGLQTPIDARISVLLPTGQEAKSISVLLVPPPTHLVRDQDSHSPNASGPWCD